MENKEEFILKLRNCTNFAEHQQQIEIWGRRRKPKILYELFMDLDNVVSKNYGINNHIPESFKEHILRALTLTKGQENTEYAFALVIKYVHSLKLRIIASMLALGQDKEILIKVISQHSEKLELHGFYQMIIQELVIRKELFFGNLKLEKLSSSLKTSKLSRLPLNLTSIETKLYSCIYGIGNCIGGRATPLFNNEVPIDYNEKQTSLNQQINLIEHSVLEKQCLSAIDNWLLESNGKGFVKIGELGSTEIEIEEIIGTLFQNEFTDKTKVRVARSTPHRIFSMLYSASANGGAYSNGEECAYGRLKAWQSFLGLCGYLFEKDKVNTIIEELENFIWFEFVSSTWFYRQLSWDIGIVCIDKRNKKVHSMIGTDTD